MRTKRYAKEATKPDTLLERLTVQTVPVSQIPVPQVTDALDARIMRTLHRGVPNIEDAVARVSEILAAQLQTQVLAYALGAQQGTQFTNGHVYTHAIPLIESTPGREAEAGLLFTADPRTLSPDALAYLGASIPDVTRLLRNGLSYTLQKSRCTTLEQNQLVDDMTGLLNKSGLREAANQELSRLKRMETKQADSPGLALLLMDIDKFKEINDDYGGHQVGDRYIRLLAQTICAGRRDTDQEGRYGGDEHVVILPDCAPTDARKIAEDIRARYERNTGRFDKKLPKRTLSIGLAHTSDLQTTYRYPHDEGNFDGYTNLFLLADARMYAAKENGRNRVEDSLVIRSEKKDQEYSRVLRIVTPNIAEFLRDFNTSK